MDELCLSCGRDTSAGGPLFASRMRGLDLAEDVTGYLCYACQPGTAAGKAEQSVPLTGRYIVIDTLPGAMQGY